MKYNKDRKIQTINGTFDWYLYMPEACGWEKYE